MTKNFLAFVWKIKQAKAHIFQEKEGEIVRNVGESLKHLLNGEQEDGSEDCLGSEFGGFFFFLLSFLSFVIIF